MTKKWKWYVYIIQCLDNTYYTGMTWSMPLRVEQHSTSLGSEYTKKHGFKKVVYYEEHEDFELARSRERQIKGWSQRKKEEILINNFML